MASAAPVPTGMTSTTSAASAPGDRHPLRYPSFCLLWLAQVFSQGGSRMFQIAIVWALIAGAGGEERSGLVLGLFMVSTALPGIVLARWIGKAVDDTSPRRLILFADGCGIVVAVCFALAAHAFADSPGLVWIFAAGILRAVCQAYIDPTLNKAAPTLVPASVLDQAVALVASTATLAGFAGAVFGAAVVGALGLTGVAVLNAATLVASFAAALAIRFPEESLAAASSAATTDVSSTGASAFSGTSATNVEPPRVAPALKISDRAFAPFRRLAFSFGVVNFFGTPILVIMPLYVKTVYGYGVSAVAVGEGLLSLGLLAGGFATAIGAAMRPLQVVSYAVGVFGTALAVAALPLPPALYATSLVIGTFGLGIMNVRIVTYFQRNIPADLKGQFFALLQAAASFSLPCGFFIFGALADVVSIKVLCAVQGLGVVAMAIYYWFLDSATERQAPAAAVGGLSNEIS